MLIKNAKLKLFWEKDKELENHYKIYFQTHTIFNDSSLELMRYGSNCTHEIIETLHGSSVVKEDDKWILIYCPKNIFPKLLEAIQSNLINRQSSFFDKGSEIEIEDYEKPEKELGYSFSSSGCGPAIEIEVLINAPLLTPAGELEDSTVKLIEGINALPELRVIRKPTNSGFRKLVVKAEYIKLETAQLHISRMIEKCFQDL